ncbi:hypothetical protein [Agilicoccus flavus]|uniref:hypothetical protein n=1 Tax=Agilicoccus flavus TaxID=2775968 RepID=UPI001CF66858|nr:hypothetical protein [Agilicoccus flavus]
MSLEADAATFRALARSSRRLWGSVRLSVSECGPWAGDGWRAWVRRPSAYRLERLDGSLQDAELDQGGTGSTAFLRGEVADPEEHYGPEATALRREALDLVGDLARPATPDEDALSVVIRARDEAERRLAANPRLLAGRLLADPPTSRPEDGVPFFVNYRRMALLEPDELADGEADPVEELPDGVPWESMTPQEQELHHAREIRDLAVAVTETARGDLARWDRPALEIARVDRVDHHGRPALEAVVRTTPAYSPRCSCCPLLAGRHALATERDAMGEEQARQIGWPDPAEGGVDFRVRLDAGTGICVEVEALDGIEPGGGFTAVVEEVDVRYPDALFTERSTP